MNGRGFPDVHPAGDVVVLELTSDQAQVLARVLARYDSLARAGDVDGYDAEEWMHTVVRLLAAAAALSPCQAPVAVPLISRDALRRDHAHAAARPVYFTPDEWHAAAGAREQV